MRSILIVLDSLGIGAAPDADRYGDWGADTLGHVFAQTPELALPALFSMGLGEVLAGSRREAQGIRASYGRMRVASPGKDSMTGHWEMAGVILKEPFSIYEKLPPQLVEAIETEGKVRFLGADGRFEDRRDLWREHAATGWPMLDLAPGESAIEISADEEFVPRRRLYEISRVARRHADAHRIARVIAQPLTGKPSAYRNASGRNEYSVVPPRTVLNAISEAGLVVEGIGKVTGLFARSGVTRAHPARTNTEACAIIDRVWEHMHDGLVFANLGDFDGYGHARDVAGYAGALAEFDAWLGGFLPKVGREDLLVITADHGNDPAFPGSDHTREEVPLLAHYDGVTGPLGTRETLADVAATLSEFFRLREPSRAGNAFLAFKTSSSRQMGSRK
jgi:phosphopentomutase